MTKTLQQHLDIAFRALQEARAQNPPNEEIPGPRRAFRDQADKIEKLRQQRVSREVLVYELDTADIGASFKRGTQDHSATRRLRSARRKGQRPE